MEIEEEIKNLITNDLNGPGPFLLGKEEIQAIIQRIEELESDLKLNASMLAKQTDMAREAETRAMKAEAFIQALKLQGEYPESLKKNGNTKLKPHVELTRHELEIAELEKRISELEEDKSTFLKKWTIALDRVDKAEADLRKLKEAVKKHKTVIMEEFGYAITEADMALWAVIDELEKEEK